MNLLGSTCVLNCRFAVTFGSGQGWVGLAAPRTRTRSGEPAGNVASIADGPSSRDRNFAVSPLASTIRGLPILVDVRTPSYAQFPFTGAPNRLRLGRIHTQHNCECAHDDATPRSPNRQLHGAPGGLSPNSNAPELGDCILAEIRCELGLDVAFIT